MLSPPFHYFERLFSRNSPFSKGAKAYFAFLERGKEKGANLKMNDHEKDADYTFSVKNGVLTMTGGEGSVEPGRVYELTRQE